MKHALLFTALLSTSVFAGPLADKHHRCADRARIAEAQAMWRKDLTTSENADQIVAAFSGDPERMELILSISLSVRTTFAVMSPKEINHLFYMTCIRMDSK